MQLSASSPVTKDTGLLEFLKLVNSASPDLKTLFASELQMFVSSDFDAGLPPFKGEHKVLFKKHTFSSLDPLKGLKFIGTCVIPADTKNQLAVTFTKSSIGKMFATFEILTLIRDEDYSKEANLPVKERCLVLTQENRASLLPGWCDWRPWLKVTENMVV